MVHDAGGVVEVSLREDDCRKRSSGEHAAVAKRVRVLPVLLESWDATTYVYRNSSNSSSEVVTGCDHDTGNDGRSETRGAGVGEVALDAVYGTGR